LQHRDGAAAAAPAKQLPAQNSALSDVSMCEG